ncbi:hypothetical protein OE810_02805 [Rhodobacteraceae bacterium XHP0102]|nr:hypothetical protein [Rhodobacteraceae bacterium XHP0102]
MSAPDPMPRPRRHMFLERESYRKNRLRDAAALMPVFGAFLFFGPAFILTPREQSEGGISFWLVYFFLAWGVLIIITFILARALRRLDNDPQQEHSSTAQNPPSGDV